CTLGLWRRPRRFPRPLRRVVGRALSRAGAVPVRRAARRGPLAGAKVICLSRHTGEVARRAGGGEQHARSLLITDLKFSKTVYAAFPLRPLRGHLPRLTGEEVD